MTQEDKELLLKDLCARLPYGIEVTMVDGTQGVVHSINILPSGTWVKIYFNRDSFGEESLERVKPYLRPMSSMTEEERNEWFKYSHVDYDCEFKPQPTLDLVNCHLSVDWLNAHHFDYNGLIEKGLALEAPEGMYKTE